ncbi:hypothetical protein HETIRDRAFT_423174 [Heterobasidion irregulare TC 32-1]|uniref:Uncharacterized protein n=1 Tax=Heterobasidion irregulare (strain TC 32-1) TaxID=747525 RepID=W4JPK6_HETIT|nr:uncharacterized protein HETIRDRAFT_423174 [Heterobasidion irregulare TC 32-1]ETW75507.1 hypothetical protein HETIRDRAFT_423174 [Heterobasidion irregulare TC 32-1]
MMRSSQSLDVHGKALRISKIIKFAAEQAPDQRSYFLLYRDQKISIHHPCVILESL